MKKKFIAAATPALALAGALTFVSPALADYSGAGAAPAGAGNKFPASSAEAPQQLPLLPIGAISIGVVLLGAGGLRLRRVDARGYYRRRAN